MIKKLNKRQGPEWAGATEKKISNTQSARRGGRMFKRYAVFPEGLSL
jgi:hypothetical protein